MKALDGVYKILRTFAPFESNLKPTKTRSANHHTFEPVDSNLETMKIASSKRQPGEEHNPGEETSRPQQCSEACGKYRKEGTLSTLLC